MQKKVPYVAQLGNMDCSIACMTMLFRYYGLDVDIVDVGQVVHIGRDGVNLTQLKQATQQFGFKCTAYRYNKQKNILDSNLPAVVYSGSHLAVIGSKTVLGQYILLDPIKGKSIVNFEQIHDTFSDILITIRPEKRIKRKKCKPKLKVAINYKLVAGIISLMLLIQALTLSIPLVEQALIDSITQSQSLLNSAYILVGCIVIAGLYFFLSIARQKLIVADGLFCREIDGLFCRSSPDIIVRRRCVLSHKRRGWLQPSPSFRYSRNLALQDELYHPVINNGPAVLVCVDKRLGTGPVNQSRDAG